MAEIYWTTKDGKRILPRQMDDSHIVNSIKMVARKTNNPLFLVGDWVRLASEFPVMRYLMYEAFVRELAGSFRSTFTDWANGLDDDYDNYNYPLDDFMPI